ncbi:MAG: non-hydrolyzing UDP-N-acetylglucosamine 2-epimerase [Bacteroidales bacterium]
MLTLLTVIGARPQFIKAASLSRVFRSSPISEHIHEIIVHTGQHYDANMSDVFFEEMDIPRPAYNLEIGGTLHGKMTGQMLAALEELYLELKPHAVLVYGDTNSTLAGALAASKLNIPVAHVEAGLRSYWMRMPEEQNRVLTDHISTWLFCPTDTSVQNLYKEGIHKGIHRVGDVMFDANLFYLKKLEEEQKRGIQRPLGWTQPLPENFVLATIHRAENTDEVTRLKGILEGLERLPLPILWPVHPRTAKVLRSNSLTLPRNLQLVDPVGYYDMLTLEQKARMIITDSGGVQKEAYFMQKPCITLRDQTEWVETVEDGWNLLAGTDPERIQTAFERFLQSPPQKQQKHYGEGHAAQKIAEILIREI